MADRRAGVASLTIDGVPFDVVGDLKWSVGIVSREGLIGQSGPQGFKEMPRYGMIGAKLRDAQGLVVEDFIAMVDVTIVAQLASGKVVSGAGMFQVDEVEVDTMEATFDVKFNGSVREG